MKALIFPGQGSQKVGMAKAMVEKFDWAAQIAEKTDAVLGRSLSSICFNGPEEELKKTVNTQPAIFFTSALLTEWVRRNGVKFDVTAGHSLGEYNAIYAAGAASYEDLLKLVSIRSEAMEKSCPAGKGAMSAIMMLPREKLEEITKKVSNELGPCVIANYNSPVQMVISGESKAVKKAGELAKEAGARRVTPLVVSGPFHSPLMTKARQELAQAIKKFEFKDGEIPVYGNVDAARTNSAEQLQNKLLDQITGSVHWVDSVNAMINDGVKEFIEIGPGKVLTGLNKKINSSVPTIFADGPEKLEKLLAASEAG
ncbi:MAG: ACP S-malonyltransferase [Candidatus Rifleibacteriota bacterium]